MLQLKRNFSLDSWVTKLLDMVISDEKPHTLYPMLFGVSCALFALKHSLGDEMDDKKRIEVTDKMLQGSSSLMGLLISRVQREKVKTEKCELLCKLKNLEKEINELKRRRIEDAKANEKVVSIFATHEQGWFAERRKLRQQIGALFNELRVVNKGNEENLSRLKGQLLEKENSLQEEKQKIKEQEETVNKGEKTMEELREMLKREGQEHTKEIWKHKSAFIELVSTQRQLEAEMGRAVRQIEAAKQELDAVLEQKEQYVLMTQKLSIELIKTREDLDQKDKILSAMLRNSKMEAAEKQMLLKEVKLSKSKRQKAELEKEKWRTVSETRQQRYSLRSMLSRHHRSKHEAFPSSEQSELNKEHEDSSPFSQQSITEASKELAFSADIRQLEGWVRCEAEKYITSIEQRHQLEVNAFTEQLRLKDEKLEAFHWCSLSTDLESKRLRSHIEGLEHDLTQLRQENLTVKAFLLDRESELRSLKEQLESELQLRTPKSQTPSHDDAIWSNVRIIKRKTGEKDQETCSGEENASKNDSKDTVLTVQSPDKDFEDKKDVASDLISIGEECSTRKDVQNVEKPSLSSSSWKMDLHALGVFYKIKRLKQQVLMFERLTAKQRNPENGGCDDKRQFETKGFYSLMSLVNKQVGRYQSLQEKADDICKRMHTNDLDASSGSPAVAKSKDEKKKLEHFLEQTFQLQRYIVATGQKLMEIQSKIASGFVDNQPAASFDMKKFGDCLRSLFREVQRGLEVRISRIIGDLEGTLACEGMIHPRT